MYCFFVLNIFLINFIYFTYSFDQNHSCYENFCFIRNISNSCPYSYKPLEFLSIESWKAFKQVINKNRKKLHNRFIYLDLIESKESWKWINGDFFANSLISEAEKNTVTCLSVHNQGNNRKYNSTAYFPSYKSIFSICQSCEEDKASCFHIIRGESKTWYEAFNDCFERGMRLASFKDNIIPKTVWNRINNNILCYWVGLHRFGYKWSNSGQSVFLSFWFEGFPNSEHFFYIDSHTFLWKPFKEIKHDADNLCMKELKKNNVIELEETHNLGLILGLPLVILLIIIIILLIIICIQRCKLYAIKNYREIISPRKIHLKHSSSFSSSNSHSQNSLEYQNAPK